MLRSQVVLRIFLWSINTPAGEQAFLARAGYALLALISSFFLK